MKTLKIIVTLVGITILVSYVNSNVRLAQRPTAVEPQHVVNVSTPPATILEKPVQIARPVVVADPEPVVKAEPKATVEIVRAPAVSRTPVITSVPEIAPTLEVAPVPEVAAITDPALVAKPVQETTEVVVASAPLTMVRPKARPKTNNVRPKPNTVRAKTDAKPTINLAALKPKKRKANFRKTIVRDTLAARAAAAKTTIADTKVAKVATVKTTAPKTTARKTTTRNTTIWRTTAGLCGRKLTRGIPSRSASASSGSSVVNKAMKLGGTERDSFVVTQLLDGNVPSFIRNLTPVNFTGRAANGKDVQITICVTPDYLAVGNDRDYVRVPMGLPAAAKVANKFGFVLPTTKMVDAIYAQAGLQLSPNPMQPGSQMSSTAYLKQHNATVTGQRHASRNKSDTLVAGQKKDLVLSNVLRKTPGRVAIYGWHRMNGKPIQPLSTVHGKNYADYSHGIRLVSTTAYVNGKPKALADLLENPQMARIISKEGPISKPLSLMASLSTR